MLLRHRRTDGADRNSHYTGWLPSPDALTVGARSVVNRVLQHTGHRAVVFGCDAQQTSGCGKFRLQPLYGLGRVRVVVLIVEWQVVDPCLLEGEFCRRELRDRPRELAIEGIASQAANDYCNGVLRHLISFLY